MGIATRHRLLPVQIVQALCLFLLVGFTNHAAAQDPLTPATTPGLIANWVTHGGGPRHLAVSPDGKWLYTFGAEGESGDNLHLRKWELATKKKMAEAPVGKYGAMDLTLTRDGALLATASADGHLKFWDPSLKEIGVVKAPNGAYSSQVHPDQKSLAVGGGDGTIRFYSLPERRETSTLKGHRDRVTALEFSKDGKQLISGDDEGHIKIWNLATGKETAGWQSFPKGVTCLAVTPDGKSFVSGGRFFFDRSAPVLRMWDFEGKEVRKFDSPGVNSVLAIAFAGDDKTLAVAGESHETRLFDLTTGKITKTITGYHVVLCLGVTPDRSTLITGSWNGMIRLWRLEKGK